MGRLPEAVAAYTSSDCPSYMCLNATRTRYDEETREVSYMWNFVGPNSTMTRSSLFDIHYGRTIDQTWFYIDGDSCRNYTAYMMYSDYQTCLVTISPYYQDNMCMLWVATWAVENIPKRCMDAFRVTCGEGYPDFSKELC
ncbi:uncharacterized protein LOC144172978 [Haemaphysalis longicornis]